MNTQRIYHCSNCDARYRAIFGIACIPSECPCICHQQHPSWRDPALTGLTVSEQRPMPVPTVGHQYGQDYGERRENTAISPELAQKLTSMHRTFAQLLGASGRMNNEVQMTRPSHSLQPWPHSPYVAENFQGMHAAQQRVGRVSLQMQGQLAFPPNSQRENGITHTGAVSEAPLHENRPPLESLDIILRGINNGHPGSLDSVRNLEPEGRSWFHAAILLRWELRMTQGQIHEPYEHAFALLNVLGLLTPRATGQIVDAEIHADELYGRNRTSFSTECSANVSKVENADEAGDADEHGATSISGRTTHRSAADQDVSASQDDGDIEALTTTVPGASRRSRRRQRERRRRRQNDVEEDDDDLPVGPYLRRGQRRQLEYLQAAEPRRDRHPIDDWRTAPLLPQGGKCSICYGDDHTRDQCSFFHQRRRAAVRTAHSRAASIGGRRRIVLPQDEDEDIEEGFQTPLEGHGSEAGVFLDAQEYSLPPPEDTPVHIEGMDLDGTDNIGVVDPWMVEVPGAFPG
jgi:hypothetical protein